MIRGLIRLARFAPVAVLIALCVAPVFSAPPPPGQASITLTNCGAADCYTHDNTWTVDKGVIANSIADGTGSVTWKITATKDTSSESEFSVHGGLTVTNTGSAPATIGNIVINLQKPRTGGNTGPCKNVPWVSVAADAATSTNGDAATSANIVNSASQEVQACNAAQGASNYVASGAQGTFTETVGSGALEFTDASDNTLFSLVPQPVIPVGGSVTLLYHAEFNVAAVGDPNAPVGAVLIPAGTALRVEAIVSFGNSGARGGSGSSATNIDVNGDGGVDTAAADSLPAAQSGADDGDEVNVRSVPCRTTMDPLPALPEEANASVTVDDTGVTTTGTVTTSNPVGFDQFPATASDSAEWQVSVDVDGGADGGKVCNDVTLDGVAIEDTLNVIVGYENNPDPLLPPIPVYATFQCAPAADDQASSCVDVGTTALPLPNFTTYSKGGFQGGGVPGQLFDNNFSTVFAGGLTIGIDDGAGPRHHATWTPAGATTLESYLTGGGSSTALTGDTLNASSTSGGNLAKQTAALTLNVGFSNAGVTTVGFSALTLTGTGTSLDGKTVAQILAIVNDALGGNGLPSGYTFGDLNTLVENLNLSFHEGVQSSWAATYLQ